MKAWIWHEGGKKIRPWLERRLPPYSKETAGVVISYTQFALFPSESDAIEWAKLKKPTRGKPQRISLRSLRSLL